jgi:hypothetical protein
MTDEGPASLTAISEAEAIFLREERETTRPFDPELMRLVHFLNVVDAAEIGVTLYMGGSVVSGMLISTAQFYRLLIKTITDESTMSHHSDRAAAQSFADFFRPQLANVEKEVNESRASKTPPPTPRHIHLRHAQTFVSGAEPLTQAVWRGRLASVDGWSIGNFGSIPPLEEPL